MVMVRVVVRVADASSQGGRLLLRSGNFHLWQKVATSLRVQCAPHAESPGAMAQPSKWHFVQQFTLDGCTSLVTPVSEVRKGRLGHNAPVGPPSEGWAAPPLQVVYRRLKMLQDKLVTAVAHPAGLNPAAFR
jgi:hypothetical protein